VITLDDYLNRSLRLPWQWGQVDCCCWGGLWVAEATGRDPTERYRGRYRTAPQAGVIVTRAGGLVSLVDGEMQRHRFERTDAPEHGDLGVVLFEGLPDDMRAAGGAVVIRYASTWMARGLDFVFSGDLPVVASWAVLR
jgi:hypothetical protein